MIVSERGNEVILEINTIPGMTTTSLLPKIAHHAGLDFPTLVEEILAGASLFAQRTEGGERRLVHRPYPGDERRAESTSWPH